MYDFDQVLLKPNIDPFDVNTQRVRRNLIVTSIIAFFFTVGASGFDSNNSSFVGIKFKDLKVEYVQMLILAALIYFLLHFIWAALDHLKENRLRLTGIAIPMLSAASVMGSTTMLDANTDDYSQSTIYSWWKKQKGHSEHLLRIIDNIDENIDKGEYKPSINSIKSSIGPVTT